jgi:DNA-binding MarR family transcriptional regulator
MSQERPEQALDHLQRIVSVFCNAQEQSLIDRTDHLTRPEVRLLLAAGLAEGRPLKDLADRLGLSRASVSVTVESLVAKGFLDRGPGADRRQVLIRLTVRGWEVFGEVRSGLVDRLGLRSWTEPELAQLAEISFRL